MERSGMTLELFCAWRQQPICLRLSYNNLKLYPNFQDTQKRYSVIAVRCVASAADGSCTLAQSHKHTHHQFIQRRTHFLRFRFVSWMHFCLLVSRLVASARRLWMHLLLLLLLWTSVVRSSHHHRRRSRGRGRNRKCMAPPYKYVHDHKRVDEPNAAWGKDRMKEEHERIDEHEDDRRQWMEQRKRKDDK